MRVLIEDEGVIYEFFPIGKVMCNECDAGVSKICKEMASDKGGGAICHQLYNHLEGKNGQGYFKVLA